MQDLNILHASPETLARAGLRNILLRGGGIKKIDNAESKEDLIDSLKQEVYDLLVIDFQMMDFFLIKK